MFEFNLNHYIDVRRAREYERLPIIDGVLLDNHPYTDKWLLDIKTGEIVYIQSVYRHWQQGWYIVLLTRNVQDSHGCPMFENINCHEKVILKQIDETRKRYKVVD